MALALGLLALAALSAACFGWGRALTLSAERSRERRDAERERRKLEVELEDHRARRFVLAGQLDQAHADLRFAEAAQRDAVAQFQSADAWRDLVAALCARVGVPLPHELDAEVLDAVRRPLPTPADDGA